MIYSYAAAGFSGQLIHVECSIRRGMPNTDIVGLPGGAVRESRERVRTVLHHCHFLYPNDRILINLAPAGLKKTGAAFDLPIATAILLQSAQLPAALEELPPLLVLGELELFGRVRTGEGILAAVASAYELGIRHFLVPEENLHEAQSVLSTEQGQVYPLAHIAELAQRIGEIAHNLPASKLVSESVSELAPHDNPHNKQTAGEPPAELEHSAEQASGADSWPDALGDFLDFADIKGQPLLKRAVEIAVAGRHNILIFGPPGCGKTMVVRSIPSLLPPLSSAEAVESTRIWSQAGLTGQTLLRYPPLRMPHHSATLEGLVGGGPQLSPGEVSLAHNGILFLDETPEFKASHLQGLREPLENQRMVIVRAGKSFWYPADFQLALAINPCPCGNLGREENICTCSQTVIAKYWKRVGGALLDRIDIRIPVSPTSAQALLHSQEESAKKVKERIARARLRQQQRFAQARHKPYNARIPAGQVAQICPIDFARGLGKETAKETAKGTAKETKAAFGIGSQELFALAVKKLGLSSRACHSVLRIARTIADLEDQEQIDQQALLEAIEYRRYGDRDIFWSRF